MKQLLIALLLTSVTIKVTAQTAPPSADTFPCGWHLVPGPDYGYYGKPIVYSLGYDSSTEFYTVYITFDTTVAPTSSTFSLLGGSQVTVITPDGYGPNNGTTSSSGGISTVVTMPYSSASQQTFDDDLFSNTSLTYPPSCAGKEYHCFAVSAGLSDIGVIAGNPVPLFSFKGNSCAGTISLLEQDDDGGEALQSTVAHNFRNSAGVVMSPSGNNLGVDRYCGNGSFSSITRQLPDGVNETYDTSPGVTVNGDVLQNEYASSPSIPIYNLPQSALSVSFVASDNPSWDTFLSLDTNGTFSFNTPVSPLSGSYTFTYQYSTVCNQFKTAQSTITWGTPLPVTLKSFNAKTNGTSVVLQWETAIEKGSTSFIIQHSINGIQWNTIGSLPIRGIGSAEQHYSYIHRNAPNGNNFYRLQIIDNDNSFAYSHTVVVYMGMDPGIKVFPNPANNVLYIEGKINDARLFNPMGKKVDAVITHKNNSFSVLANISELPPGIYFLSISTPSGVQTFKVNIKH